jgi:rod shape-determining protein MreC
VSAVVEKLKKAHYIALGTVLFVTLVLLRLPERSLSHFKAAIGSVFVPLFGLAGSSHRLAERAAQSVVPRQSLVAENERLRRQNGELLIRLQEAEAAARENERLRACFAWSRVNPSKLRLARVIARDPANWWRSLHIDLGRRDGLKPGLPVRAAEGLVGRVAEVSETRSRVALLGDPNCRVSALVLEGRQAVDTGVISGGSSVVDPSMVELSYLSRSSGVKAGQTVVTSDLGGNFPKGIPIGQVVDSRSIEYGLYTDARVKLAVNLTQLEEVWVMCLP